MNHKQFRRNNKMLLFRNLDTGALTFEWIVLTTIIVIGIIAGIKTIQDAITCETAGVAESIFSINQEYHYEPISIDVLVRFTGIKTVIKPATVQGNNYIPERIELVPYDYTADWLSKTNGSKMIDTDSASGNRHVNIHADSAIDNQ